MNRKSLPYKIPTIMLLGSCSLFSFANVNWTAIEKGKKVDAGVNAERVLERDRVRVTQRVSTRRAPTFNRENMRLEGARLQRVDQRTGQLITQIQELIKREKQKTRLGELKMRLAELYYDRAALTAMKESEEWAKQVDNWNAFTDAQRARTARPVLTTPNADKVRRQSLGLYNELEQASRGGDQGRSQMIARDEVLFYLAMTHTDLKDNKRAIPFFEELTTRFAKSEKAGMAKLALADAYFDGGAYKKALPLYLSVSSDRSPQFASLKPYSTYRAAWCYSNLQDYKKAVMAFLKTIEMSRGDRSARNISFVREAYGDLSTAFALAGQYNDGWIYFREKVRNKEMLERYELTASQIAKDRGHYKIAEFFYDKLLSRTPMASFAKDLAMDRADNAKKSGNVKLYADKLNELLRDYGTNSKWLKAQKMDKAGEKAVADELVALIRREAKDYHSAAQKRKIPSILREIVPLYAVYFLHVPSKSSDTPENIHEMRFYYADLLYEAGDHAKAAEEYANVGPGKHATVAAYNRILAFREAAKKDKKYSNDLIAATNDFVAKYPNDQRAGDLLYASATQSFEAGSQEESIKTLRDIVARFGSTKRGVDAAERILFLQEKSNDFNAISKEADGFLANSALMAAGGDSFRAKLVDIKQKAEFKKIEQLPEGNKSQQIAKANAYLNASAGVSGSLKENSLNNALIFFKRAEDKQGQEKTEAELVKHFPKSNVAKGIFLGQADSLLEKAQFTEAIRQYEGVLRDFKGDAQEREKITGNLFFVKAHLEDAVVPELKPGKTLSASSVKLGQDYLKDFKTGSNRDFAAVVLAYRRGANINELDQLKRTSGINADTRKQLSEAEVVLKVRARNSSSYLALLKSFRPNPAHSMPTKEALAEIAFAQIEPKYKAYNALRISTLPQRIAQTLSAKIKSLEALEKDYTGIISYGDGVYSLMSLERVSDSYRALSDELGKISDPDAKKELEPFVKSFQEKARSLIDLCLSKGAELKIRGSGVEACRRKATWRTGVQSLASRQVPDLQWTPRINHKRPLTEFAEASFRQNKIGAFLLAQALLERSESKMSAEEKFFMDTLLAIFDWRDGRGAAAESMLLDLSSRSSGANQRIINKNLGSLYLQVGDFSQANSVLSRTDDDAEVRALKALVAAAMNEGRAN